MVALGLCKRGRGGICVEQHAISLMVAGYKYSKIMCCSFLILTDFGLDESNGVEERYEPYFKLYVFKVAFKIFLLVCTHDQLKIRPYFLP